MEEPQIQHYIKSTNNLENIEEYDINKNHKIVGYADDIA